MGLSPIAKDSTSIIQTPKPSDIINDLPSTTTHGSPTKQIPHVPASNILDLENDHDNEGPLQKKAKKADINDSVMYVYSDLFNASFDENPTNQPQNATDVQLMESVNFVTSDLSTQPLSKLLPTLEYAYLMVV